MHRNNGGTVYGAELGTLHRLPYVGGAGCHHCLHEHTPAGARHFVNATVLEHGADAWHVQQVAHALHLATEVQDVVCLQHHVVIGCGDVLAVVALDAKQEEVLEVPQPRLFNTEVHCRAARHHHSRNVVLAGVFQVFLHRARLVAQQPARHDDDVRKAHGKQRQTHVAHLEEADGQGVVLLAREGYHEQVGGRADECAHAAQDGDER
mmetsp:Transcript_508/g.1186  ORF Transcript_508/g.1186 Transcript_508/m.1186 type:complete len:207 (+) Transcript_508:306-926(+)